MAADPIHQRICKELGKICAVHPSGCELAHNALASGLIKSG